MKIVDLLSVTCPHCNCSLTQFEPHIRANHINNCCMRPFEKDIRCTCQ